MSDKEKNSNSDLIKQLHSETAKINWSELQGHYARGSVIKVEKKTDLIDVAVIIANDDKSQLEALMNKGIVNNASDVDAQKWLKNESEFWTVVVAPWVIVQEIDLKLNS